MVGLVWGCKQALLLTIKNVFLRHNKHGNDLQISKATEKVTNYGHGSETIEEENNDDVNDLASPDSCSNKRNSIVFVDHNNKSAKPILKKSLPSNTSSHKDFTGNKKKVTIQLPTQNSHTRHPHPSKACTASSHTHHHRSGQSAANLLNISNQLINLKTQAKQYLIKQHLQIRDSIELLFDVKSINFLQKLSPSEMGDLLFSLRRILFSPPAVFKDVVISQVLEMLHQVTYILELEDLHKKCQEVSGRCRSRQFYTETDICWTDVQTLLVCVWCSILQMY